MKRIAWRVGRTRRNVRRRRVWVVRVGWDWVAGCVKGVGVDGGGGGGVTEVEAGDIVDGGIGVVVLLLEFVGSFDGGDVDCVMNVVGSVVIIMVEVVVGMETMVVVVLSWLGTVSTGTLKILDETGSMLGFAGVGSKSAVNMIMPAPGQNPIGQSGQ